MNPNENQPVQPAAPTPQAPAQDAPLPQQWTPGIANAYQAPAPQPAPTEPAQPVAQDVQPVQQEVQPASQPATQPVAQPVAQEPAPQSQVPAEPVQPAQAPQPQLSYDEYLDSLTKDIKPIDMPKPTDVDNTDPEGLVKFFEDYGNKLLEQARQENQKQAIVQSAEREAWGQVFTKYPEIQKNQQLRDTIHNIRMGAYGRGQSLSPLQVADSLVGTLREEYYKKGVNDTNVQTQVVDSQPLNGGGQPAPQVSVNYEALQTGGQDAAVTQLENLIRAGKL